MALTFIKDIQNHIKNRSFSRVYLLTGDEAYLIRQIRHALVDALVAEDDTMNYHPYQMDRVDLAEISELAMTFPFFSEKRVILLDSTNVIKDGREVLPDLFEKMPETTCMIIIEEKVDKRSAIYKWIRKNGYVADAQSKDLKEADVKRYIAGWLKKSGKKMRGDDASYLISLAGKDLYTLNQEVSKLISYAGEEEVISREDIDALVSAKIEDKIFELTDAIAGGSKDLVKKRYREMIMLREPPLRILYMLIRQYRILLIIYDMDRRRMQDAEIAQAAGIRDFAVRRNRKLLGGYNEKTLTGVLELCLDTETRIKTGLIGDQIGLEALLISLTERIW